MICNDLCPFPQTHLQSCDCKIIPCPNPRCQITLERRLVHDHVITTCQWRAVQCGYCDEKHAKCDEEVNDHISFVKQNSLTTSCKFTVEKLSQCLGRVFVRAIPFEIILNNPLQAKIHLSMFAPLLSIVNFE